MTKLSRDEILDLPASVLLDPVTDRAAAYNGVHRTLTNEASPALVAYARAKGYRESPYDESRQDKRGIWRPLPDWATPDIRARLVIVWTRSGSETDAELRQIPRR